MKISFVSPGLRPFGSNNTGWILKLFILYPRKAVYNTLFCFALSTYLCMSYYLCIYLSIYLIIFNLHIISIYLFLSNLCYVRRLVFIGIEMGRNVFAHTQTRLITSWNYKGKVPLGDLYAKNYPGPYLKLLYN